MTGLTDLALPPFPSDDVSSATHVERDGLFDRILMTGTRLVRPCRSHLRLSVDTILVRSRCGVQVIMQSLSMVTIAPVRPPSRSVFTASPRATAPKRAPRVIPRASASSEVFQLAAEVATKVGDVSAPGADPEPAFCRPSSPDATISALRACHPC